MEAARTAFWLAMLVVVTPLSLRAWKAKGYRFPRFPRWMHFAGAAMLGLFALMAWLGRSFDTPEQTRNLVLAGFLVPAALYAYYILFYILFGAHLDVTDRQ
jgi:hypothetical protein